MAAVTVRDLGLTKPRPFGGIMVRFHLGESPVQLRDAGPL